MAEKLRFVLNGKTYEVLFDNHKPAIFKCVGKNQFVQTDQVGVALPRNADSILAGLSLERKEIVIICREV